MSDYRKALEELYDLQQFAIKLGLDNIRALMEKLDNPHRTYPVIHIAGTNGKGSTAWYIAKILESTGLKTGLFTSPHLVRFNERIQINGEQISDKAMVEFWKKIKNTVLERKATFFDTTTALAFDYFRNKQVDVAVIETGLGGRLDSTNIVEPVTVVITPIQIDHEKQLGSQLGQIAAEKAGIIKEGVTVFSALQSEEALRVLKERAVIADKFYYLPDVIRTDLIHQSLEGLEFNLYDQLNERIYKNLRCRQTGEFQLQNIALAYLTAADYLNRIHIPFNTELFSRLLLRTIWPGRLQVIRRNPDIIFDVSHNADGIRFTTESLMKIKNQGRLLTLIGLVQDKDYRQIAGIIAGISNKTFITEPDTYRKLDGEILAKAFGDHNRETIFIKDFQKAFDIARNELDAHDTLLTIGSHYLIGSLLKNQNNLT